MQMRDDLITYHQWYLLDPEGSVLSAIMNICLKFRRIPCSWKQSRTILIYKKGEKSDPANWRPISITRTIYKLYSGLLSSRLTLHLVEHRILHQGQKGFMPADGVLEHNYLLQTLINRARGSGRGEVAIAFCDFADAFGSIPHVAIKASLLHYNLGEDLAEICADMYKDCTTTIQSSEGATDPIPLKSGVHQGDPFSSLIFNLALNPVLSGVDETTSCRPVSYADDVALIAENPAHLQEGIDKLQELSEKISCALNPGKCASLHIKGEPPRGTRQTRFTIDGQPIRFLNNGESYDYLGKPV